MFYVLLYYNINLFLILICIIFNIKYLIPNQISRVPKIFIYNYILFFLFLGNT